jgi:hypothetical protein
MRLGSRRLRAIHAFLATAVVILGGCAGSQAAAPAETTVYYSLKAVGTMEFDSVFYDGGHGVMVKVVAPPVTWNQGVDVTGPGSIEARVYVHALGAGVSTIKVDWTNGAGSFSDSSFATSTSASHFTLSLAHRTI